VSITGSPASYSADRPTKQLVARGRASRTATARGRAFAPVGTEILNLFCDEVFTPVKRSFDVLKFERERLVLPRQWA
jgi:hypothetical protein